MPASRSFGDFAERPPPVSEPLVGLPSTIEIWGGPDDAPALLATMHPNRDALAASATIESVARPDEDGRTPRRWWNSFVAAQDVDLACEIPLTGDPPNFPVLFCVGYDAPDAEPVDPVEILALHTDAGRLGIAGASHPDQHVAGAPTTDLGD